MFNRILVPLDGSPLAERAIMHAEYFARVFGGQVVFLQVLDPAPFHENTHAIEPLNWQIRKAEADLYLRGVAERLREHGIATDHALREGRTAENIVDFAHTENIDLVVLSTHGAGGLTRWNMSSVVNKVLNKVYLPLLIVRSYLGVDPATVGGIHAATASEAAAASSESSVSSAPAALNGEEGQAVQPTQKHMIAVTGEPGSITYRRILLPIDSSRRAECALPAAVVLATPPRSNETDQPAADEEGTATLVLVGVVRQPELPIPQPYPDEIRQMVDHFNEMSHTAVESYLKEMQGRIPTTSEIRVVESDSVPSAIYDLAEKENADLVILCAHGQTGGMQWPYGTVARNYIEHGDRTVLVIQDVPRSQVRPTTVESAAEKYGRR